MATMANTRTIHLLQPPLLSLLPQDMALTEAMVNTKRNESRKVLENNGHVTGERES